MAHKSKLMAEVLQQPLKVWLAILTQPLRKKRDVLLQWMKHWLSAWLPRLLRSSHSPARSTAMFHLFVNHSWTNRCHVLAAWSRLCHMPAAQVQSHAVPPSTCTLTELREEQISSGSDPVQSIHSRTLFFRTNRSRLIQHYCAVFRFFLNWVLFYSFWLVIKHINVHEQVNAPLYSHGFFHPCFQRSHLR